MPAVEVKLTGPHPGALMRVDESLCRFGTDSFGIETMREYIRRGVGSLIEAGFWLSLVPEAYRAQVVPMLEAVVAAHRGRKLTDDLVRQFVEDSNREIGARLQPVASGGWR